MDVLAISKQHPRPFFRSQAIPSPAGTFHMGVLEGSKTFLGSDGATGPMGGPQRLHGTVPQNMWLIWAQALWNIDPFTQWYLSYFLWKITIFNWVSQLSIAISVGDNVYMCIYIYICVICIYIYMYIHLYIYIYTIIYIWRFPYMEVPQ